MNKITIGRSSQNDIVIFDRSERVSRFHAEMFVNPDRTYTLIDKSTHGTTVNGQRLHNSSRQVRYGDRIMFADSAQLDWSSVGNLIGNDIPSGNSSNSSSDEVHNASPGGLILGAVGLFFFLVGFLLCALSSPWEPELAYFGFALVIIAFIMGVIGLILSATGLGKARRGKYRGTGMLKAGLALSIITVAFSVVYVIYNLIFGLVLVSTML